MGDYISSKVEKFKNLAMGRRKFTNGFMEAVSRADTNHEIANLFRRFDVWELHALELKHLRRELGTKLNVEGIEAYVSVVSAELDSRSRETDSLRSRNVAIACVFLAGYLTIFSNYVSHQLEKSNREIFELKQQMPKQMHLYEIMKYCHPPDDR